MRKAQAAPRVDRPQRVEKVQQKGGREQNAPDLGPPERHEDAKNAAGQRDRNQKKDVAREVADDECQQDERTDQPQARTNDVPQAFELPPPAQAGSNQSIPAASPQSTRKARSHKIDLTRRAPARLRRIDLATYVALR